MKIILFIVPVMIFIVSCQERKTVRKTYWPIDENGRGGGIQQEYQLVGDSLQGTFKSYYLNGKLKFLVEYDNGRLIKISEVRDTNGNKLSFGKFDNGFGYLYEYDRDGDICRKGQYKDGLKEGIWYDLNYNGEVIGKTKYKNGFALIDPPVYANMYN